VSAPYRARYPRFDGGSVARLGKAHADTGRLQERDGVADDPVVARDGVARLDGVDVAAGEPDAYRFGLGRWPSSSPFIRSWWSSCSARVSPCGIPGSDGM